MRHGTSGFHNTWSIYIYTQHKNGNKRGGEKLAEKMKRFPDVRHKYTHENLSGTFRHSLRFFQSEDNNFMWTNSKIYIFFH